LSHSDDIDRESTPYDVDGYEALEHSEVERGREQSSMLVPSISGRDQQTLTEPRLDSIIRMSLGCCCRQDVSCRVGWADRDPWLL